MYECVCVRDFFIYYFVFSLLHFIFYIFCLFFGFLFSLFLYSNWFKQINNLCIRLTVWKAFIFPSLFITIRNFAFFINNIICTVCAFRQAFKQRVHIYILSIYYIERQWSCCIHSQIFSLFCCYCSLYSSRIISVVYYVGKTKIRISKV